MLFEHSKTNKNRIIEKLVLDNCFLLGQTSKLTNKNFTRCLLGTRDTFEIFKLYEIRHLLLRTYPLIYSLFSKDRSLYGRMLWRRYPRVIKKRKLEEYQKINPNWDGKIRFYPFRARKNIPPKILFASTTTQYAHILEEAALRCQMPWQAGEWLNGSITAMVSPFENKMQWNSFFGPQHLQVEKNYRQTLGKNKEDIEYTQEKKNIYEESYRPTLILIPDVKNNSKILGEIKEAGVPILGLVSSDCQLQIDYPIFAQDMSVSLVHFFCHFMATLIAKEMAKIQHKLFTKIKSGLLKKDNNFFYKRLSSRFWFFKTKIEKKYYAKKRAKIFSLQEHFLYAKSRRKYLIRGELILPWFDRAHAYRKTETEEFMDFERFYYFFYGVKFSPQLFFYAKDVFRKMLWKKYLTRFTKFFFLKNRRYLSLLFDVFRHSSVSRDLFPANLARTAEIILNQEWAKKKTRGNKMVHWTSAEQKRVLIKAKKNPHSFENILQHQWASKKGRLRYNNANKMYYWTPLKLLLQTPYFKRLTKKASSLKQSTFYKERKRKYAYQKYKQTWFNALREKLLTRVEKKKVLISFFSMLKSPEKKFRLYGSGWLLQAKEGRKKKRFFNYVQAKKKKKNN